MSRRSASPAVARGPRYAQVGGVGSLSVAIANLVLTSNDWGEYMSCEGYIIEITKSGLIPCWIIVQELNNIKDRKSVV